jgi:two-component system chemotaxis response regulator CheY
MSRTALVVDDSPTMQEMVALSLTKAGFKVKKASNGKEGLANLNEPLDLIITDLNMPEMDGLTFIKNLRTNMMHRFTPVLVLTTEGGLDRKDQGRLAGATGWLTKPFDPEKLMNVVKKVLR